MSMNDFIDNEVKTNDVLVFMKGTPAFPQCGFSGQVAQIMDYLGVEWKGVNVLADGRSASGCEGLHQLADRSPGLCQRRIYRWLRYRPRNVPVWRTESPV